MTRQGNDGVFALEWHDQTYLVPHACPHRGGFLRLGTLDATRGTLACPLHHATFEIASGRRISGPPCGNLRIRETLSS